MGRAVPFFLVAVTLGLAIFLSLLGWSTLSSNWLGWFLLISGLVYFFGVIVVYWIRRIQFWKPRAPGDIVQQEQDDGSFWFITLGMISAFYFPPIEFLYLGIILPRGVGTQIVGLLLISLGSSLFIWARRTLGRYYSGHLSVVAGQQLIQTGPYHFIRHPAYAGYLLIVLGLSIGYSSVGGLIIILCLLLPSIIYRIQVEDLLLAKSFGSEFQLYVQKTKRLLPGVW